MEHSCNPKFGCQRTATVCSHRETTINPRKPIPSLWNPRGATIHEGYVRLFRETSWYRDQSWSRSDAGWPRSGPFCKNLNGCCSYLIWFKIAFRGQMFESSVGVFNISLLEFFHLIRVSASTLASKAVFLQVGNYPAQFALPFYSSFASFTAQGTSAPEEKSGSAVARPVHPVHRFRCPRVAHKWLFLQSFEDV